METRGNCLFPEVKGVRGGDWTNAWHHDTRGTFFFNTKNIACHHAPAVGLELAEDTDTAYLK